MISIVVPVYYGEKTIEELYRRVSDTSIRFNLEYELILVDDASPDRSREKIRKLAKLDRKVKGILLSKNCGQHIAILAGLKHCVGDYVVVMDCDLQDRPEEINGLYNKLLETDFDMILARRNMRQDNYFKKLSSVLFYRVFDYFVGSKTDASIGNFGIYKIGVIRSIVQTNSESFFFPASVSSAGFTRDVLDVKHDVSGRGFSTYSIYKLIRLAVPIIFAHSAKPLFLTAYFTFASIVILLALNLIEYYFGGASSDFIAYSTLISIAMIALNILMLSLYIGEIHKNSRNKLLYYIHEKLNL